MHEKRIIVAEKQLSAAIAGWLRHIPEKVWEEFIEHKILSLYKRQSFRVQSLESDIADHVASEMAQHDWQVTHPPGKNHG